MTTGRRILILTQYFPPEVGATQTRVEVFARHLAAAGHEVTVIAEVPNHPIGVVFEGWRGRAVFRTREHGYEVIRVWVYTSATKTFWRRIAFYVSYGVNSVLAVLMVYRRRPDVVFASSPPLPVLLAAWAVAALLRRPFVADIRDIWPAVGIALGEVRGRRMLAAAERLERAIYKRAAAVTCVTRGFVEHVRASGASQDRVKFLPNGTVPELFDPQRRDPRIRAALGAQGRFVVGYVGLHGIAQGLDAVLDAARLLRDDGGIRFLFVGEGPVKHRLVARAEQEGLANVRFQPQVPVDEVAPWLNACDVLLVPLRRLDLLTTFVPSKLFDLMCCARPVILMVDGEAREILEEARAGVFVEPEDSAALAETIRRLAAVPEECRAMGERGRTYVLGRYLRENQARELDTLLRAVATGARRRSPREAGTTGAWGREE